MRMKAYGIVTVSILIVAAGCSVGPDYEAPTVEAPAVTLLSDTTQTNRVTELGDWWEGFEDPLLTSLVTNALAQSPTVTVAINQIRAARALLQSTERSNLPQISADGNFTESRSYGARESGWDHSLTGGLDARWELDLFGGIRREMEQAQAALDSKIYNWHDVELSLAAEVASTYLTVRKVQTLLSITRENLALQERNAALVRKQYEAQTVTRFDLVRAEAQVAATAATIPAQEAEYTQACLKLEYLCGQLPYSLKAALEAEPTATARLPVSMPGTIANELLRRRPDIRVAEENIKSASAAVGMEQANLYPKFYLNGSLGLSSPELSPWSSYTRTIGAGPSFAWNIFGFGYYSKRIESKKIELESAVESYRDTVLSAYQETEAAWQALLRERQRTGHLTQAMLQQQTAATIAESLYREGETDYSNVITARASALSAEQQLTEHRDQLLQDLIALYKALGGSWSERTSVDPTAE